MDLIGLTEIAELLGMTRAGADKLVKRGPSFPPPLSAALTGRTRAWSREEVMRWAQEEGRPIWPKTTREELAELQLIGPPPAQKAFVAAYTMAKTAAVGRGKHASEVELSRRSIYHAALEGVRQVHPEFRVEMPPGWLDEGPGRSV